jgi:hypothetical protein
MNPLYLSRACVACYDNEPPASAPVPKPTPAPAPAAPKAISEDEFQRILAEDRRKHMGKLAAVEKMLQEVSESKNLTVREREQVEQQLEELRQQTRTKEEQVAHEKKQLGAQYEAKLKEVKKAREEWERRFREETVERDLMDAAIAGDSFNTNTVMDVLRPRASLEEIMDEKGKGTGKFRTVVQYTTTDSETGEPITLPLAAKKAVEKMQAEPAKYGNLFKAGLRSGIGSSAGPAIGNGGKIDPRKLTQEQYMKIRAENPALLGLRPPKGSRR